MPPAATIESLASSQPHNSIQPLPVFAIWRRAAALPFLNFPQLLKFGGIPFLLSVAASIFWNLLIPYSRLNSAPFFKLVTLALFYIPFDVSWNLLAVLGRNAVGSRGIFPIGRTEGRYLVVAMSLKLSWLALFPAVFLFHRAQVNFDRHLVLETIIGLLALTVVILILSTRPLLLLPAVALNAYAGLAAGWRQSRGAFEQLLALIAMARLPYFLLLDILDRILTANPTAIGFRAALALAQLLIFLLSEATAVGVIADSYRRLTAPATEGATSFVSPPR
jgi:hypothetical protein